MQMTMLEDIMCLVKSSDEDIKLLISSSPNKFKLKAESKKYWKYFSRSSCVKSGLTIRICTKLSPNISRHQTDPFKKNWFSKCMFFKT